ncbi:hypothetical protein CFN78_12595 [Amycolatopsis antarctica]|uniref:YcaO domain-containing protein n=1 Tax=Amycolatopsis antarctica TaxID=1854586 RepID=A0A263D3L8_9PSEU|nr:TOMM precursor leader peptide-binding protein [Amycolatopsis antarctica]OZM73053.1 hypothetical protein CFN78_12595 [Amycolatopsis antarctica]
MLTAPERDRDWLEAALLDALPGVPAEFRPRVGLLGYARPPDTSEPGSEAGLPVSLAPAEVFVGPPHSPDGDGGPCVHCFALRWHKRRGAEQRDVLDAGADVHAAGPIPYLTPFLVDTVAALSAGAAHRERAHRPGAGMSEVYRVEARTLLVRRHWLLADPACTRCSPAAPSEPPVITLRPRPRPAAGVDRLRSATDLLPREDVLANPACGMLGGAVRHELAHTTTAPATGHFLVRDTRDLFPVHWSGHADSYADSAAFALCEAMERYAGLACARVPTAVHGRYAELAERAVDPELCGLYEDGVRHPTGEVFAPYHPDLEIHWVWGYSAVRERPVLVPRQLAYYRTEATDAVFVKESSNGCASGSCVEEAVLHGLFELVERDAFLLAWYGAARLPEIDADTCPDVSTRRLLERVRRRGYRVRVLDARIDLDIPVVVVMALHRDPERLGALSVSAAAHLDPGRALASALREVASSVADLTERTEAEQERIRAMARDYSEVNGLADHAALFGLPEMSRHAGVRPDDAPPCPFDEVYAAWQAVRPSGPDLTGDLRFCRDHLAGAGFDVVIVDQTTPEGRALGIHTVRVLAPGMIPIDFGWSKQRALRMPRMFSAFRRAGWRGTDLTPGELHRVPHPFM